MKIYRCKGCNEVSTSNDINDTIDNCCMNRQQRRNYVPIEKTKYNDRKWYNCPKCGKNIRRIGWEEQ